MSKNHSNDCCTREINMVDTKMRHRLANMKTKMPKKKTENQKRKRVAPESETQTPPPKNNWFASLLCHIHFHFYSEFSWLTKKLSSVISVNVNLLFVWRVENHFGTECCKRFHLQVALCKMTIFFASFWLNLFWLLISFVTFPTFLLFWFYFFPTILH